MSKLVLHTDITDWQDETLRNENIVEDKDDIRQKAREGISTPQLARAAIVSRALNFAPADIMNPDKLILQAGATLEVTRIIREEKAKVETPSGTYLVPATVGKVTSFQNGEVSEDEIEEVEAQEEKEEYEPSYVSLHDPAAIGRATDYLARIVPGHVWHRLLVIYENGGDVKSEAELLKAKIDEMVSKLASE